MKFLVTGGLGFIGGTTAQILLERGHEVLIVDCADKPLIRPSTDRIENVRMGSTRAAEAAIKFNPDAILHFAALSAVPQCEDNPGLALHNNLCEFARLIGVLTRPKIVNSSSSAVYGDAINIVSEAQPPKPISWYGWTKIAGEEILPRLAGAHVSLRYGNVAGSAYGIVERVAGKRLIPAVLSSIEKEEVFRVNGTDYRTQDGTCVRDYVHVGDVAEAHIAAGLRLIEKGESVDPLNVGTGVGVSVRDVVKAVEGVVGKPVRVEEGPRRPGDPAFVVLNPDKIHRTLKWKAKRTLSDCIRDSWKAMEESPQKGKTS